MEFLNDLNDFIEVNITDQQIDTNFSDFNLLVDNKTGSHNSDTKPHLKRSREHFQSLLSDLAAVTDQLDNIKNAAERYAQQKKSVDIQIVKKALTKIQIIFENNIYRYGMISSCWSTPLYDFRVWAGLNMDQGERMPLGYEDRRSDGPDNIFMLLELLQQIDISQPEDTWKPDYEEFYALIQFEKVKINAYLRRLDYFEKYNEILEQRVSYYILKSKIFDISTMTMQKKMIATALQYMSLCRELLEEIKAKAGENLNTLPDQTQRAALAFHTEQLIDEVDRLASHGHFNGMSLLTGRFAKNHERATASMPLLLDAGITQTARMYIPTLTAYVLVTPDNIAQPWKWDVNDTFASKEETVKFINKLQKSIRTVEKSIQELKQLSANLQEENPYPDLQFDVLYAEKIQDIIKTYPMAINKLEYTARPEHTINTQSTLLLLTLKYAHVQITEKLHAMRELAVQACNSVYSDQERRELNKQFASLIKSIETISQHTSFNGEKLLHHDSIFCADRSIKWTIIFDESGMLQKDIEFYPLDPESLGLSDSRYYVEINSPDEANRCIGILDMALSMVHDNKAIINSHLQSAVIGEHTDSLMHEYTQALLSAKAGDKTSAYYIEYVTALIEFTKQLYAKAQSYAWMAASGAYTNEDRMKMAHYLTNLIENTLALLERAQELSDNLPQNITFSSQEKQKLSALTSYIKEVRTETTQFREEFKNRYFLQSISGARSAFEKIARILSIKE
jgi:flagellin-like hook-associated protein FlgL